jgi:plastocyanin
MKQHGNRGGWSLAAACVATLFLALQTAQHMESSEGDATFEGVAGCVSGVVRFRGNVPTMQIADAAGKLQPLLTVDRRTRGLRYAVVYLTRIDAPEGGLPADRGAAVIDQKEYVFSPRVTAIHEAQPVTFTNHDPANHNVRAVAVEPANQFNVMTGAAQEYVHHFQAPATVRPIRLGCDIHAWMRAWIYVFDHDRFAVTDQRGKFAINGIPPGRYTLHVRQPDGGLRAKRDVTVTESNTDPVELEFSEADLKPAQ